MSWKTGNKTGKSMKKVWSFLWPNHQVQEQLHWETLGCCPAQWLINCVCVCLVNTSENTSNCCNQLRQRTFACFAWSFHSAKESTVAKWIHIAGITWRSCASSTSSLWGTFLNSTTPRILIAYLRSHLEQQLERAWMWKDTNTFQTCWGPNWRKLKYCIQRR